MSADKRRTAIMRLPLSDLSAWHMLVTCPACADERTIAIGMLAKITGDAATLASVIPRLRCRFPACRRAPSLISGCIPGARQRTAHGFKTRPERLTT